MVGVQASTTLVAPTPEPSPSPPTDQAHRALAGNCQRVSRCQRARSAPDTVLSTVADKSAGASMEPRYFRRESPSPDSLANPSETKSTIKPLWDARRSLASLRRRASRATGRVMLFRTWRPIARRLGLVALSALVAAIPPVAQNVGRVLDQLGVFGCLDRRMGLRWVALRLADGVDPMERLRVLRLAQEHQVVVVAEDVPDLVDPATNQLDLMLEVLPLRSARRDPRAGFSRFASGPNLNQGYELHHRDHLQPGCQGCQVNRHGHYKAFGARRTERNPRLTISFDSPSLWSGTSGAC